MGARCPGCPRAAIAGPAQRPRCRTAAQLRRGSRSPASAPAKKPSAASSGRGKRVSASRAAFGARSLVTVVATAAGLFCSTAPAAAAPSRSPAAASSKTSQWLSEATEHFRAGRYAEARVLFDQVLARDPKAPARATIAFNAAVSSYALEQYADALARFEA